MAFIKTLVKQTDKDHGLVRKYIGDCPQKQG